MLRPGQRGNEDEEGPTAPDVRDAFDELEIGDALGQGTFKVAFAARRGEESIVLKILKKPIAVEIEDGGGALDLLLEGDVGPDITAEGDSHQVGEQASAPIQPSLPPRVQREVEAMRALDSPWIVRILEGPSIRVIGERQYWWYLEPFYPGGTLEERLTEGPLEADDAIALCEGLLAAVDDLWTQVRHVHRDIKPANVVFGHDGRPVLLDLGIALDLDATPLTEPGALGPRTNRYCAPEQLVPRATADLDARTDMFSVGVTVFEAWTGVHPFAPFDQAFGRRLMNGEFNRVALQGMPGGDTLKTVLPRLLGARQHERFRLPSLARHALVGESE